jgi:hypothetical protein
MGRKSNSFIAQAKVKSMKKNQQNSTESTVDLTAKKTKVITALIRGATVSDATRQASIDRSTYYLWLKSDEAFLAELNRAKQERLDVMRAQLRDLGGEAINTIRSLINDAGIAPGIRLKSALAVLQSLGTLQPEQIGELDPDVIGTKRMFDFRW